MTDDTPEEYRIFVLKIDRAQQAKEEDDQDGIKIAATMKSLAGILKSLLQGEREDVPKYIHYFLAHVSDLLQFAKQRTTTSKLQAILETLHRAESALEQKEDVAPPLRDARQLMRKVLSHEEVEKIAASSIEIRRKGMAPIIISESDVWEQANRILQEWCTPENEDQRIEYIISYSDGCQDGRWLKLPLFYQLYSGGQSQIGPVLELGKQIISALERTIDLGSKNQISFDAARHAALSYLRRYEVGGYTCEEVVTTAILKIQQEQWSPRIVYRHSLHSASNQREGFL